MARRSALLLALTVFFGAAAIATHRGEFWPFSSFSMFASAGRPWQRALVRAADSLPASALARSYSLDSLPGAALPLAALGVPQNDLSGLVQRAESWNPAQLESLKRLFGSLPCRTPLILLRVRGELEGGALRQTATPVAWLDCENALARVRPLLAEAP